MAESSGEKTELPTPKKLRDAREKGQVCSSRDIVSTALLIVLLSVATILGMVLVDDLEKLIAFVGEACRMENALAIQEAVKATIIIIVKHTFIFVGAAMVTGVAANMAQIGFLFTFEPIKPNLEKINPVSGFKKIFCKKNLFEFVKNVVKVSFLGYLIHKLIIRNIPALLPICFGEETDVMPVLKVVLKDLVRYTIFGYVVIAAVDFFFQQKNYTKEMMMTKDEVKREYKEMEGSQEVKQAQKQFQQEILNGPPPAQAARKSTVIVTNPTHLAVGIYYDPKDMPMPKVTVKGADAIAALIRREAYLAGVPIMENVPLARALYKDVQPEQFIPEELVDPVVEVLKWVKQLENERKEQQELDSIQL